MKSFGRRQAYESLRGRNPRCTGTGLWEIRFLADVGQRSAAAAGCLASPAVAALRRGAPACCAEMTTERDCRPVVDAIWYERSRSPRHACCGAGLAQSVPGHGGALSVGRGRKGGALGWLQRAKVSMMIMCPPQHGHGGRASSGSFAMSSSGGSGGGATASSSRARARLVLRAELASRP